MDVSKEHVKFNNHLRRKVKNYFDENKFSRRGGFAVTLNSILVPIALLASYLGIIFLGPVHPILLFAFLFLTLGFHLIAVFAVMHDASHNALSNNKWINLFMTHLLMAVSGVNGSLWIQKHVHAHHKHTNVASKDKDIDGGPMFVFSPHLQKRKKHRFQHLYGMFLYCFLIVRWIVIDDIKDIAKNTYHLNKKQLFLCSLDVIFSRVTHITIAIIIPTMIFGHFLPVIIAWLIYNALLGLSLSLVFQPAHVNTKTQFYNATETIPENFTVQQLRTTADFATNNRFLTWAIGGLNFQVIHHLFPAVNCRHYPKIQEIMLGVLKEYPTIEYNKFPTFRAAIKDHLSFLKQVART